METSTHNLNLVTAYLVPWYRKSPVKTNPSNGNPLVVDLRLKITAKTGMNVFYKTAMIPKLPPLYIN